MAIKNNKEQNEQLYVRRFDKLLAHEFDMEWTSTLKATNYQNSHKEK